MVMPYNPKHQVGYLAGSSFCQCSSSMCSQSAKQALFALVAPCAMGARTTSHKLPQHWQLTNLKIQKASMTSAHGRLHLLHMSGGCLCPSLTQAALSAAQLVCSRKGTVWTSTAYVGQKTVNFWTGVRRPVAIKQCGRSVCQQCRRSCAYTLHHCRTLHCACGRLLHAAEFAYHV